jgi:hypothetical protein
MKTVTFELGGRIRSVMVPQESAAYLQVVDYTQGTCDLIIRMKLVTEHSALTSVEAAKTEYPSRAWRPVTPNGWMETAGGLPAEANPYYKVQFAYSDGQWNMIVTDAMQEFKTAQRDTLALGAPLPQQTQASEADMQSAIKILASASGGGRWG